MRRLFLLIACLVAASFSPARASDDYCGYGRSTAILLIDRTTHYDTVDRSVFLDAMADLINRLGPGDRLVALTMAGAFTDSRELFNNCKPGCPAEGFFAQLMSACSPTMARSQLSSFTKQLALVLARMLKAPEQTPLSDLFRTVAEVTHDYATQASDGQPIRTVVIFSDLLENSTVIPEREFRELPVAGIIKRLESAGLVPDVSGATVQVYGFGRDDSPRRLPLPQGQRRRIAEVWEQWFKAGGATEVDIGFR
jgi:hypothetical protein